MVDVEAPEQIEEWERQLRNYKNRKIKAINFCKNYHLSDTLIEDAFDIRFNKPELIFIFTKKYNVTKKFFEALRHRVGNNDHIIIVIYRNTNSGKSWAAIALAYHIKNFFLKTCKNDTNIFISFSDSEFSTYLPQMKEMDVMIRDETPKMAGTGIRTIQKNLYNIMAITRANQYCFLFVSPKRVQADTVTFYLEAAGINKKEEKSRFIVYDQDMIPLGRIFINKPKDEEFLKEYERRKLENIEKLVDAAGLTSVEYDFPKMEKQIKKFTAFCKENKAKPFVKEVSSLIPKFNFYNKKNSIKGPEDYVDKIIYNVRRNLRTKNIYEEDMGIDSELETKKKRRKHIATFFRQSKHDIIANLRFDDVKIYFDKFYEKHTEKKQKIFKLLIEGVGPTEISKNMKKTSHEYVSNLRNPPKELKDKDIKSLRGYLHNVIGKAFERFFYDYLKSEYNEEFYNVVYDGRKERPDIYIVNTLTKELVVISCKCLDIKERRRIDWKAFYPEYKFAQESIENTKCYKKINVFLAICFAESGIILVRHWDFRNPKNVVLVNKY